MDSRYLHPDVDDIYSQLDSAMEQPTYDSVIFESNKPVLESELNEMQAISNANIKNISAICAGGECALVLAPNATFTAKTIHGRYVNYVRIFIKNGFILHRGHLIRLTSGTNKDEYDNIATAEYINIDFDDEPLIDDRISIETTKRRKYKITLSSTENDASIVFYKMEDDKFAFMLPIIDLRSKNNVILYNEYEQVDCKIPYMIGENLIGDLKNRYTKVYMGGYNKYNAEDLFEFGAGNVNKRYNIISWTSNSLKIEIDGGASPNSVLRICNSTRIPGIEIVAEDRDHHNKSLEIKFDTLLTNGNEYACLCSNIQLGKTDNMSSTVITGDLTVRDNKGKSTTFASLLSRIKVIENKLGI